MAFPEHQPKAVLENDAYHLDGTQIIAQTEAGVIYRIPIGEAKRDPTSCHHPLLEKISRSRHHRRQLETKLNWNSRSGRKEIGKPNSAYVVGWGDQLFIDHLLETPDFARDESTLHEFMWRAFDYREMPVIYSGHLAPLIQPSATIRSLITFDAFRGPVQYEKVASQVLAILRQLCGAGFFPLTSDAFPMRAGALYGE